MFRSVIFQTDKHPIVDAQEIHERLGWELASNILWAQPHPQWIAVQHDNPLFTDKLSLGVVVSSVPVAQVITGQPVQASMIGNASCVVDGKRRALPDDRAEEWFQRKLGDTLNIAKLGRETIAPAVGWRAGKRVLHHRVVFNSKGTVRNSDMLNELIRTGVGRGKAYGCGMLVVTPA